MTQRAKSQIFEYIFGHTEVPPQILDEFSRWLVDHESDRETEMLMLRKWEEYSESEFQEADLKGLKSIRKSAEAKRKKKIMCIYSIAATVLVLIGTVSFFAGWIVSDSSRVNEITYVTAQNNIGEYTLPDGTKVWLNENTRLVWPEKFDGKTREVKLDGQAYFEVMKDADRPFVLTMRDLKVEVLGTAFGASCYAEAGREEIVLKNGSVKVSAPALAEPIILKPNEKIVWSPFESKIIRSTIDVANRYRWYEKYLVFDNARLDDILANIEYRYHVEIISQTSVPMDKRLSLTIIYEPLETIMDVLSALLPIRYERHDDSLMIKDK